MFKFNSSLKSNLAVLSIALFSSLPLVQAQEGPVRNTIYCLVYYTENHASQATEQLIQVRKTPTNTHPASYYTDVFQNGDTVFKLQAHSAKIGGPITELALTREVSKNGKVISSTSANVTKTFGKVSLGTEQTQVSETCLEYPYTTNEDGKITALKMDRHLKPVCKKKAQDQYIADSIQCQEIPVGTTKPVE